MLRVDGYSVSATIAIALGCRIDAVEGEKT